MLGCTDVSPGESLSSADLTENAGCNLLFSARIGSVEDWSQIIFSDESKFQLYKSNGRTYVRRSVGETLDPKCVQQPVKHGGGHVMVWGAFTF